jgi:hypothetical protein
VAAWERRIPVQVFRRIGDEAPAAFLAAEVVLHAIDLGVVRRLRRIHAHAAHRIACLVRGSRGLFRTGKEGLRIGLESLAAAATAEVVVLALPMRVMGRAGRVDLHPADRVGGAGRSRSGLQERLGIGNEALPAACAAEVVIHALPRCMVGCASRIDPHAADRVSAAVFLAGGSVLSATRSAHCPSSFDVSMAALPDRPCRTGCRTRNSSL